jgi:hypothetical protein
MDDGFLNVTVSNGVYALVYGVLCVMCDVGCMVYD